MAIQTVDMADCIHASVSHLPLNLPKVGGYVTGTPDIQWVDSDWNRFAHSGHVRINQQDGSDPLHGEVLDVEPGAWTVPAAVAALKARHNAGREMSVYVNASTITQLANDMQAAGLSGVNIWLANWSLSRTQAAALVLHQFGPFPVRAVQWASPSSNPNTLLPGTSLTLHQANADLSVADANWFPQPASAPPPPPPAVVHGVVVFPAASPGTVAGKVVTSADNGNTWQ